MPDAIPSIHTPEDVQAEFVRFRARVEAEVRAGIRSADRLPYMYGSQDICLRQVTGRTGRLRASAALVRLHAREVIRHWLRPTVVVAALAVLVLAAWAARAGDEGSLFVWLAMAGLAVALVLAQAAWLGARSWMPYFRRDGESLQEWFDRCYPGGTPGL